MVHALSEIRRVLVRDGSLIDLRPLAKDSPVEVVSRRATLEAGRVSQLAEDLADDLAADRAMAKAAERNWFIREREEFFPFFYYWNTPNEMQKYIEEDWADYITIDQDVWKNVRSMWAVADADARVRINLKMVIARWRVVKEASVSTSYPPPKKH
jgi:hypothetical protein